MEANREAQQQALRALDQLNIPYELIRHPAAGQSMKLPQWESRNMERSPKIYFCRITAAAIFFSL